jgi:putative ubiquitin-RnfH superfamily antitoxin RatB of RatAB toxin-antitoxin module
MSSILQRLQRPKIELTVSDILKECRENTFEEFLHTLEEKSLLEDFLKLKVSDVIKLKQMAAVADEEVEDEAEYKEKVLKVIQDIDMKVNKLGILSNDIKEQIGGNGQVLRKVLAVLKEEKKVWSTGKTKGMKWVLYKHKDKVEAEFNKG